jgi:hypothetical protein
MTEQPYDPRQPAAEEKAQPVGPGDDSAQQGNVRTTGETAVDEAMGTASSDRSSSPLPTSWGRPAGRATEACSGWDLTALLEPPRSKTVDALAVTEGDGRASVSPP